MECKQGVITLRYKKKQCIICKKKLKTEEMRIGNGHYWCIEDWAHSEDFLQSCMKCSDYFIKDGFHTTCPKCTVSRLNYEKTSGWYFLSAWKYCDNCKVGVRLIVVNWMHDWERCPNCLIKLPIKDKKILDILAGIVKRKDKKNLPQGQLQFEVQTVVV